MTREFIDVEKFMKKYRLKSPAIKEALEGISIRLQRLSMENSALLEKLKSEVAIPIGPFKSYISTHDLLMLSDDPSRKFLPGEILYLDMIQKSSEEKGDYNREDIKVLYLDDVSETVAKIVVLDSPSYPNASGKIFTVEKLNIWNKPANLAFQVSNPGAFSSTIKVRKPWFGFGRRKKH